MDTRAQRVESIVTYLVNRPGEAEKLTGATVEKIYAKHGVEVSSRQIRRDIEDARRIAADRLRSPDVPHWSEDVTGAAIRITIGRVLLADREPTIPQLRQAVAAEHGRAIGDGELRQIARRVYRRMYIDPRVDEAQQTLRERPNHQWEYHQARSEADPLNYYNPFGVDSDEMRLRALVLTNQLLGGLRRRGILKPSDHNTALRALRLWLDLANDMGGDEPDGSGGVTVSRLDQVHYG